MVITWRYFSHKFQRYFDDTLALESHLSANPDDYIVEVAVDVTSSGVVPEIPGNTSYFIRTGTGVTDLEELTFSGGNLQITSNSGSPAIYVDEDTLTVTSGNIQDQIDSLKENAEPSVALFSISGAFDPDSTFQALSLKSPTFITGSGLSFSGSNPTRINVLETGAYSLTYNVDVNLINDTLNNNTFSSRIRLNNSSTLNETLIEFEELDEPLAVSTTTAVTLQAGDFLELEIKVDPNTSNQFEIADSTRIYLQKLTNPQTVIDKVTVVSGAYNLVNPTQDGIAVASGTDLVSSSDLTYTDQDGLKVKNREVGPNEYFQTKNPTLTNLNSSTGGSQLSWNTSSDFNSNSSIFSENSQGVEVLTSGNYEVYCNIYSTTTATRSNYGLEFTINGTEQGVRGACAYVRDATGHNESSNSVKQILSCNANDIIGVKSFQLSSSGGTVTAPAGKSVLIVRRL